MLCPPIDAVTTVGTAEMRVCFEVPKRTPIGSVVPRLATDDISSATMLFIQLLKKTGVATTRVGVQYTAAVASETCVAASASSSEEEGSGQRLGRHGKKREPRVDNDFADTIGVAFKFNVYGNALDVAAAVRAANHIPYERSGAVLPVFQAPMWLNYGSGNSLPSTREFLRDGGAAFCGS